MIPTLFIGKTCRKGHSYLNNDVITNPQSKAEFRKVLHARGIGRVRPFEWSALPWPSVALALPEPQGCKLLNLHPQRQLPRIGKRRKEDPCVAWIYTDALWHGRLLPPSYLHALRALGRSLNKRHHPKRVNPDACKTLEVVLAYRSHL